MRTYALYGKNRKLLVCLLVYGVAVAAVAGVSRYIKHMGPHLILERDSSGLSPEILVPQILRWTYVSEVAATHS